MQTSRRDFLKIAGGLAAIAAAGAGVTLSGQRLSQAADGTHPLTSSDPTLHFLNRITYGPRPAEVERARQIGAEAFLEEQLNPESIDDSDMDAILATMPILFMNRQDSYALRDFGGRAMQALREGMVERAVHSKRQLLERMVEFWSDHFNVVHDDYANDMVVFYREAIRQRALGNFRDMLLATSQSPAMLYYLDQTYSDKDHPNENYARELLELHTLGVDGGYTETDVKEAARALTGWTVHDGVEGGFYFNPEMHDSEAKTILGHTMPAGRGIEDGLHLISIVANHPATPRFVCRKLVVRFVSDAPPESLIERMVQTWVETRGEIKPVLRVLFTSEEFYAAAGQKFRRPLDFYIGVRRATGSDILERWWKESVLEELAQMPYGWHPPNGYPDIALAWKGTSSLLARWNTATLLTHEALSLGDRNLKTDILERTGQPGTVGELVDAVALQVFGVTLPAGSRHAFIQYAADDGDESTPVDTHRLIRKVGTLYGMMLASPLYQWR
jgi:uncharacterized protein (DUF1800 family)